MSGLRRQFRSFDRPVRLLAINQLTINTGFYMLMPYLAAHLAGDLGLAAWIVGLVLGVRNLSQQGMFLVGGTLADRWGYKPVIVTGCALRTAGFALLGFVDSVPALVIASAATGFAGALFNPAVRAYVAVSAGDRRVEAFALFNVFAQTGVLVGPLIGLALTGIAFQLTCVVAAVVFATLTVLQWRALPAHKPGDRMATKPRTVLGDWRVVLANRRFLAFALMMTGSSVLSFQVYLALPLETRRLAHTETAGTVVVGVLFAVSALVAIAGQLRITAWCRRRWSLGRCLTVGLLLMSVSFLVPLVTAWDTPSSSADVAMFVPLVISIAMLTLGVAVVFPFEMDTIVSLANGRLVATHYGLYHTICGIGVTLGNLATGVALDAARADGVPWLPWAALTALGAVAAVGVYLLGRTGRLEPAKPQSVAVTA